MTETQQTKPGPGVKSDGRPPSQSDGVIHRVRNEATEKDMPAIPWCSPIREQKSGDRQTVVDGDVTCPHCRVMIDRHKAEKVAAATVISDGKTTSVIKTITGPSEPAAAVTEKPEQDKPPIFAHILDPVRQGDNSLCGETGTISQTTSIAEASCPKCLAIAGEMLADQDDDAGFVFPKLPPSMQKLIDAAMERDQAKIDALRDINETLKCIATSFDAIESACDIFQQTHPI